MRPVETLTPSFIQFDGGAQFQLSVSPAAGFAAADLAAGAQLADGDDLEILLPTTYPEPLGLRTPDGAVGKSVTIGIRDYLGTMHEVEAAVVGVLNPSLFGSTPRIGTALTDALVEIQNVGRPADLKPGYFAATATFDASAGDVAAIKADFSPRASRRRRSPTRSARSRASSS